MHPILRKISLAILIILLIICGIYFSKQKASKNLETIYIGALFPLTGGLASYGEPAQKAAQLAINEINAEGGIDGQRIEIDFQDHKCDPKLAVSAFQQLHTVKNISFYMAVGCSGTVLSLAPQLTDAILLGSVITSPKISGSSPWVFRNYVSDADEARLFAEEIKKKGYSKVGMIYEETDYAKGLALSLQEYLSDTSITFVTEGFVTNSSDVRTQITKIKAAGVDVLFISPQTVTSGDIVLGEMQRQNVKTNLIVNENILKSKELLSKYTALLEDVVSADYVLTETEALNDMLAHYTETFGEDCPQINICATIYDDVYLFAEAIEKVGTEPQDVREYLSKITYSGVSGEIQFNEQNDRTNAHYSLFTVKDGIAIEIK